MDLDAFAAQHRQEWARLAQLSASSQLSGQQADELLHLYQRAGSQLSQVQAVAPGSALADELTRLVLRARQAVAAPSEPGWKALVDYLTRGFPAAVYRARAWWITVGVLFCLVGALVGWWVAANPDVQASIATPEEIQQIVNEDFESYYSENPASSFAAQVFTNNAWLSAQVLVLGVAIVPAIYVAFQNAVNVGVIGGLMAANDRLGLFFGLITPHGLLELTAVFVACGAGMRLGWAWIEPGARTRSQALAQEGRATLAMAFGLALVLFASGLVEAFVTPSGLNTATRIGIGVAVEVAFLAWVFVIGGRAARAGEHGDLDGHMRESVRPVSG